jgi:hypothetical protein
MSDEEQQRYALHALLNVYISMVLNNQEEEMYDLRSPVLISDIKKRLRGQR